MLRPYGWVPSQDRRWESGVIRNRSECQGAGDLKVAPTRSWRPRLRNRPAVCYDSLYHPYLERNAL